ncbi:hypothetical protein L6R49_04260 [Myxococcota bacterium]|nr:hypothetical protein [Myxococcota bacterium]
MRTPSLALIAVIALASCTDYELVEKDDNGAVEDSDPVVDPPIQTPELQVSPTAVALGPVCGEESVEVTLTNAGEGALTITALTPSGAWTFTPPSLPLVLNQGEQHTLTVTGGPGSGALTIESDDPSAPTLTVPLASDANAPPVLTFLAPGDGDVLPVSVVTELVATLEDDRDAPESIGITWTSDVEGVLSTDPASSSGLVRYEWDAAARLSGTHLVTLTGTDSCGASSEVQVSFCQDAGYTADSLDLATWYFAGNASYDSTNSWVELTKPLTSQSGTAFQTASTASGDNVVIQFSFFASGGSGADGLSLTALDSSRMTGFVGELGGGLGYKGLPGWSVEIDTYYNGEYNDPTPVDHVSFHLDGDVYNPILWATLPEMEDGKWHEMSVSVSGTTVVVDVDGVNYINGTVSGITAFPAYVGFSASTGALTNSHLIDALEVTRSVCEGG